MTVSLVQIGDDRHSAAAIHVSEPDYRNRTGGALEEEEEQEAELSVC